MDKIAKVPHLREELDWLDQTYGVEKEGFFHQEHWQLLVAIMLSAQSTDKQVDEVLPKLYGRFPTVQEIAQATEEEIGEEIKSVGLYKSKAKHVKSCCMQLAEQYGGEVPTTIEEMVKLAGVGRKTATLFLADAYGIPGVTVDTHVFRVANRLGLVHAKDVKKTEEQLMEHIPQEQWSIAHHWLIWHGRRVCSARNPKCQGCPCEIFCEFAHKQIKKTDTKQK